MSGFSPTGYWAIYWRDAEWVAAERARAEEAGLKDLDIPPAIRLPVVSFSEMGLAMVCDSSGLLVQADSLYGFQAVGASL